MIQDITPDTRVSQLLESFPQLEAVLLEMSPAFAKLKNPVLRNTVARVATLRQIAQVGNIPLAALINQLRHAAGMKSQDFVETEATEQRAPDWFHKDRVVKTLDARPILEAGGHPVGQVLQEIKDLQDREIYQLITPFLPAPLIDKVKSQGFLAWTISGGENLFRNYFVRVSD